MNKSFTVMATISSIKLLEIISIDLRDWYIICICSSSSGDEFAAIGVPSVPKVGDEIIIKPLRNGEDPLKKYYTHATAAGDYASVIPLSKKTWLSLGFLEN